MCSVEPAPNTSNPDGSRVLDEAVHEAADGVAAAIPQDVGRRRVTVAVEYHAVACLDRVRAGSGEPHDAVPVLAAAAEQAGVFAGWAEFSKPPCRSEAPASPAPDGVKDASSRSSGQPASPLMMQQRTARRVWAHGVPPLPASPPDPGMTTGGEEEVLARGEFPSLLPPFQLAVAVVGARSGNRKE